MIHTTSSRLSMLWPNAAKRLHWNITHCRLPAPIFCLLSPADIWPGGLLAFGNSTRWCIFHCSGKSPSVQHRSIVRSDFDGDLERHAPRERPKSYPVLGLSCLQFSGILRAACSRQLKVWLLSPGRWFVASFWLQLGHNHPVGGFIHRGLCPPRRKVASWLALFDRLG